MIKHNNCHITTPQHLTCNFLPYTQLYIKFYKLTDTPATHFRSCPSIVDYNKNNKLLHLTFLAQHFFTLNLNTTTTATQPHSIAHNYYHKNNNHLPLTFHPYTHLSLLTLNYSNKNIINQYTRHSLTPPLLYCIL